MSRKTKDLLTQAAIYISAGFTVFILVVIIGFVLIKGLPSINISFLTRTWEDTTSYGFVQSDVDSDVIQEGSVDALGITLKEGAKGLEIVSMDQDSILKTAINAKGAPVKLQKGDFIVKADRQDDGSLRIKSIHPGGGIVPMTVTTIYMILLSLIIAAPIGILSAVYLIEYAKPGKRSFFCS